MKGEVIEFICISWEKFRAAVYNGKACRVLYTVSQKTGPCEGCDYDINLPTNSQHSLTILQRNTLTNCGKSFFLKLA